MCLNNREAGRRGDAALVVLVSGHHDVALIAPAGAPAVLHQPVLLPLVAAIAHYQHTMVQLGAAAHRLIIHTCEEKQFQQMSTLTQPQVAMVQ